MNNVQKLANQSISSEICPIKCAVAQVAVEALNVGNIEDLLNLNKDLTGASEVVAESLDGLSKREVYALLFALNLVKDLSSAKAVALAQQH